jgi:hypothetical protein
MVDLTKKNRAEVGSTVSKVNSRVYLALALLSFNLRSAPLRRSSS